MAHGMQRWYNKRGLHVKGTAFHIDQWGSQAVKSINNYFKQFDFQIINGRSLTLASTNYHYGQQAPCRQCADARRKINDEFIQPESSRNGKINIICRGLHLSDIATSLLWRYVMIDHPLDAMIKSQKGKPLTRLWSNTFLAKPLTYVREFEAQQYSLLLNYQPLCCGCPACLFPSRRDIIEETLLQFNRSPLWEFSIPGIQDFLCYWSDSHTVSSAKSLSAPGLETKKAHLPDDFGYFVVDYFLKQKALLTSRSLRSHFDDRVDLDEIGKRRLQEYRPRIEVEQPPLPAILNLERNIGNLEALLIATLGPFWGAIGLSSAMSNQVFLLQEKFFGIAIDDKWSQVTHMLNKYYGRENVNWWREKKSIVRNNNLLSPCVCSY
jgi:hypothetical protein